jgi:hypothetical protein
VVHLRPALDTTDVADAPWGFGLTYTYDPLGRLASVSGSGDLPHTLELGYTSVSALDSKGDLNYTYGSRPHAPTQVGDWTLSYDANGNRVSLGPSGAPPTTTYTYSKTNLLTRVVVTNTDATSHTVHYVYDGDGALVLRASGECTYTLYAGAHYEQRGFPVYYAQGDPPWWSCESQETAYFNAGGPAVALRSTYPYEEAPFQWEMTSTVHYLHRDRLGSLTEVTDEDKNVVIIHLVRPSSRQLSIPKKWDRQVGERTVN